LVRSESVGVTGRIGGGRVAAIQGPAGREDHVWITVLADSAGRLNVGESERAQRDAVRTAVGELCARCFAGERAAGLMDLMFDTDARMIRRIQLVVDAADYVVGFVCARWAPSTGAAPTRFSNGAPTTRSWV
jgi:hypothetical protein